MDAKAILQEHAFRLKDPVEVKRIALASSGGHWMDLSLASGYPGLLLLFAHLERDGLVQEGIAHEYVLAIRQAIEKAPLSDLSLYNGVAGICFALRQASHEGTRYVTMRKKLDHLLSEFVEPAYLKPLREYRQRLESPPSFLHDLINGIPGIGRYLLEDISLFGDLIASVLKELIEFSKPTIREKHTVPGWHLSPQDPLNRSLRCPKGNFNLGLAHGIPGVLSFLSIAALKGMRIDGQLDAMRWIAQWIREQAVVAEGVIRWHSVIPLGIVNSEPVARDAWCYGVPGIARSLFLCGKALNDLDLQRFALSAFMGVFSRTREEWNLPGPMICHGISGLLLLTHAMAQDCANEDLISQMENLQHMILSDYKPETPFGYQDIRIHGKQRRAIDSPCLLEGTAGMLLVLSNMKTSWHLPFMVNA